MNIDITNKYVSFCLGIIQHYNASKYWRLRKYVIDSTKHNLPKKIIGLFYIKRCDAYNCASFGTDLNKGAEFKTVPHLPHGLKGIFVHPSVKVGKNVTIYQHVSIGKQNDQKGVPIIGDNVIIGTGAVVLGDIKIGDNVIIGANAVVIQDIPDNCIAVGVPAEIKRRIK